MRNKTKNQNFRVTALAVALTAAYGVSYADGEEMRQLTKPESNISMGVGSWSGDRPQQGIYDGMRDGGKIYGLLDFNIAKRDDETGTWLNAVGSNLGLDTWELSGEWLRQGKMGFSIDYGRTPRDNPNTFNTGLAGIGSASMTIRGADATTAQPIRQVELGTHRDKLGLGFYRNLLPGLDLNLSFKNEEKKGTRQWGRGGQPEFLVEPINATTNQFEATLNYMTEKLQLSGGYYGSWYNNNHNLIDTIREGTAPATLTNHIYLSLPLDNEAHQLYLNTGYNFSPTTRGTLKLSRTRLTQNEHMPTVDIAALSWGGAPDKLNGKINTTQVQAGITAQPLPKLSVAANFNYHNAKDETPIRRVIQTDGSDAGTTVCDSAGECVDNTPFSFKTRTLKLEATYRLPYELSLIGGVEDKRQERDVPVGVGTVVAGVDNQRYVPFVSDLDERTYRLQLRRSISETVNGSIAYLHSKREPSQYSLTDEAESDMITPLHIAERKRNKLRATVDWAATETLSVQFNAEKSRDKYPASAGRPYGVREGEGWLYSLDVDYAFSDGLHLTGWYSRDNSTASQMGQRAATSGASAAEKDEHLRDMGESFGLGLRATPNSTYKFGADFQWTQTLGKYGENLVTAGTAYPTATIFTLPVPTTVVSTIGGPLPDITSRIVKFNFFAEYALKKNADVRFDFIHERWLTNDWSWQTSAGTPFVYTGCSAACSATGAKGNLLDGTTVTANQRQISSFVSVRYIYRFQ